MVSTTLNWEITKLAKKDQSIYLIWSDKHVSLYNDQRKQQIKDGFQNAIQSL